MLANAAQPPTAAPTSTPSMMSLVLPPFCAAARPPTIPPTTMPSAITPITMGAVRVPKEMTSRASASTVTTMSATMASAARKMPQKLRPLGSV